MDDSPSLDFAAIVHGLRLAVFVFHRTRILYQNEAAATLRARLQKEYQADLTVMLRDHLLRIRGIDSAGPGSSGDAPDRHTGRTALRPCLALRGWPRSTRCGERSRAGNRAGSIRAPLWAFGPRGGGGGACAEGVPKPGDCHHAGYRSNHHETTLDPHLRQDWGRFQDATP